MSYPIGQPGEGSGAPIGLGGRFQPIPGAQLVQAPGDGVARIPAARGTPVHAVTAGVALEVTGSGGLVLRGEDGHGYRYAGLDAGSVTVGPGGTVRAGDILGSLVSGVLELRIVDADGDPVDAVAALLGSADPNELGYAAVGQGLGIDPDPMDRDIAEHGPQP